MAIEERRQGLGWGEVGGLGGGRGIWVTWLSYLVASCNKRFTYLTTKLLFHYACESKKGENLYSMRLELRIGLK